MLDQHADITQTNVLNACLLPCYIKHCNHLSEQIWPNSQIAERTASIPQRSIQNINVYIFVLNGVWEGGGRKEGDVMEQAHSEIWEIGLL